MTSQSDDLDLATLADASGVSPRTIRYYVQQGLLPSPGTRGPGTRYDRALVERLQLIKLLQRSHWPLSKIRDHLEQLDEEGVRRELGHLPELPLSDSALTYVRRVMGHHGGRTEDVAAAARPASAMSALPDQFGVAESLARPAAGRADKWEVRKSTWERIRLAPDVELCIRRPATREQNKLVERLVQAARDFFSEEP